MAVDRVKWMMKGLGFRVLGMELIGGMVGRWKWDCSVPIFGIEMENAERDGERTRVWERRRTAVREDGGGCRGERVD